MIQRSHEVQDCICWDSPQYWPSVLTSCSSVQTFCFHPDWALTGFCVSRIFSITSWLPKLLACSGSYYSYKPFYFSRTGRNVPIFISDSWSLLFFLTPFRQKFVLFISSNNWLLFSFYLLFLSLVYFCSNLISFQQVGLGLIFLFFWFFKL